MLYPLLMVLSTQSISVEEVNYKDRRGKSTVEDRLFLDMAVPTHTPASPTLDAVGDLSQVWWQEEW